MKRESGKFKHSDETIHQRFRELEEEETDFSGFKDAFMILKILKTKNLAYLGALKKNEREIPLKFQPNKVNELGSSLYGFTKDNILLNIVPKKNKAMILFHHFTIHKANMITLVIPACYTIIDLDLLYALFQNYLKLLYFSIKNIISVNQHGFMHQQFRVFLSICFRSTR